MGRRRRRRRGWSDTSNVMVVLMRIQSLSSFLLLLRTGGNVASARSEEEIRERFYGNMMNSTAPNSGEGSIAKMFDRVLEKEFSENDQPEGTEGSSFNNSVAGQQAVLETVAKITHEKGKINNTRETNKTKSFQLQDVFNLENEDSDDITTLIDNKDNEFVMLNKKLISDLVVIIVSAAIGGIVIVGYLLAGSLIGPGGLKFIHEMVQVETMQGKMYLLLLGTTAFSLVTTPLLFKLIPAVMNLVLTLVNINNREDLQ